jgi:phosphate uptake regulator
MRAVKKILPILLLCFGLNAKAQTSDLQQLLLDIEKLTQFKSILSDMKTGYQIYSQGYNTVSSLAKGNLSLHSIYLTGLLAVSPTVRNYSRIADILVQQANLVSEYKRANSSFRSSGSFNASELSYMSDVYTKLVEQSLDNLDELNTILTDGKLRMSDAERLKAIDRVYTNSSDQLNCLRSFNRQGIVLSLQRSKDLNDTNTLKKLYGL